MSLGIRFTRAGTPAALAVVLVAMTCLWFSAGRAEAADPAVFDVGAGSASINPDAPQYVGGYGYKQGPTKTTHDDLEARAFVVGNGDKAVAFVSVDLVGWFAAYDGEQAPYGIDATRQKIADALKSDGYNIGRESVIISSTHVHAAPTVVGIWGTLDGAYLKKVSDAAVAAATRAADEARPSEIWTGVGNIRSFIWQNGQGTNHPDGFEYDNELPILWARDPDTGATNALYANVPNHPDQYQVDDNNNEMSADWPGYARRKLDALNGGTAVLAAGTLGRQEPPGSVTAYSEVEAQGEIVANEIQRTMAKATPLTDDTIAASEQYLETPADNDDLLLGISIFSYPGSCIDGIERCSIPRSKNPPYMKDVSGDKVIGTYVEAARIGDVAFATNPGEAFPEVNFAIRDGVSGARQVNAIGQASDMLGYYYERGDYTDEQFGSSDFEDYNVGPDLPQDNADKALAGLQAIGFTTTPQLVHAPFNADVTSRPGLQWYPDEYESTDPTFNILGSAAKSQDGTALLSSEGSTVPIEWDFGDGTAGTTAVGERFDHTFPGPGSYEVTATITSLNSKTRTWTDTIIVDPPLTATAKIDQRAWNGSDLSVSIAGGQGKLVAAHWTCQDGAKVSGLTVNCASKAAGNASVTVTDGAGNTAEASVAVAKAPPKPAAKLKITKAKVNPTKAKRGKNITISVKVSNKGNLAAPSTRICMRITASVRKGIKPTQNCKRLGTLRPGKARPANFKLKTNGKARSKAKPLIVVTAKGAKTVRKAVVVRTKP